MPWISSLRALMAGRPPVRRPAATASTRLRPLTTASPALAAPKARMPLEQGRGGRRKGQQARSKEFLRVKMLKKNMFSPAPPPLRMGRLRHLRHWTIHRAWQLFRRQDRLAMEKERQRMHMGMYHACEELRLTAGPGDRTQGYLYRVAMEKKGVWGLHGVPIEYARFQTEWPANEPWNHDWKR